MKKNKEFPTKVFSVRTENELLESFEKILSLKNINKNNVINEFITNYVLENIPVQEHKAPVSIFDNRIRFGYEISKFDAEDAQFLIAEIKKDDPDIFEDDYLDFLYKTYLLTGVKYSFSKLNIAIYNTWHFTETQDSFGKPTLDYVRQTMLYDFNSSTMTDVTYDDYTELNINTL